MAINLNLNDDITDITVVESQQETLLLSSNSQVETTPLLLIGITSLTELLSIIEARIQMWERFHPEEIKNKNIYSTDSYNFWCIQRKIAYLKPHASEIIDNNLFSRFGDFDGDLLAWLRCASCCGRPGHHP